MEELIFELILTAILTIVAKYVIPWLKEKRLLSAAIIAVEAAEQMFLESKSGPQKFEQAKAWLLNKFKLTDEEAKKLIEAAVYNIKNKK